MATCKTNFHARSKSLPSRPHPIISEFDEHLCRLRDSQATSTSSSSFGHKLSALQDLRDCVDKLLVLPITKQVFVQDHHQKYVDAVLEGSLRILDLCSTTKDALSQTKDCIHELQSVIRRRQGSLDGEIKAYLSTRKMVKKTIQKTLKNLKNVENKTNLFSEGPEIVSMFREVEAITLTIFESLFSFISEPKSQSKSSGWSLVSKLMLHKRVASEEQEIIPSEFAIVDAALEGLTAGCKTSKSDNNVHDVQKKLNSLELCIQDLEDGIDCLFRRMIKTRASFLNIFN